MTRELRPLAVVTGASTGIGLELARCCMGAGMDVLAVADEPAIHGAVAGLEGAGQAQALEADLATAVGVDALEAAIGDRAVAVLIANAGRGLGHAFVEQSFAEIRRVLDTNITGTVDLVHRVARRMRAAGEGRILITGSIAGFIPGTYQAVYNASKAFLDSFALALRAELKDTGVTVTCLIPGATDTEFFARADLLDTEVATGDKQPAEEVAAAGALSAPASRCARRAAPKDGRARRRDAVIGEASRGGRSLSPARGLAAPVIRSRRAPGGRRRRRGG